MDASDASTGASLVRTVLSLWASHPNDPLACGTVLFFREDDDTPTVPVSGGAGPAYDATASLKRAYKRLVLRLHPDKNASPGAAEAFQQVQAVFESCLAHMQETEERQQREQQQEEEEYDPPPPPPPNVFDAHHRGAHAPRANGASAATLSRGGGVYPPPPPPRPSKRGSAEVRKAHHKHHRHVAPPSSSSSSARSARNGRGSGLLGIPLPPDVFATLPPEVAADAARAATVAVASAESHQRRRRKGRTHATKRSEAGQSRLSNGASNPGRRHGTSVLPSLSFTSSSSSSSSPRLGPSPEVRQRRHSRRPDSGGHQQQHTSLSQVLADLDSLSLGGTSSSGSSSSGSSSSSSGGGPDGVVRGHGRTVVIGGRNRASRSRNLTPTPPPPSPPSLARAPLPPSQLSATFSSSPPGQAAARRRERAFHRQTGGSGANGISHHGREAESLCPCGRARRGMCFLCE